MANMIVMLPHRPNAVSAAGGGTGAANLLTPDPKEVYSDGGGGGARSIDLDLGSVRPVDVLFLGFLGGSDGTTFTSISATGGATSYTETTLNVPQTQPAQSSSPAPLRRHWFVLLPAPVSVRYIRVTVQTPTVATHTAGILAVGEAFRPIHNREWGGGRQIIDTGVKEPLFGGGFGIAKGAVKSRYRWTLGDLLSSEVERLYDLALNAGETRPVLVVEDPDPTSGLNERIHYGLFESLQAFERLNPEQTRWSFSLTEWV